MNSLLSSNLSVFLYVSGPYCHYPESVVACKAKRQPVSKNGGSSQTSKATPSQRKRQRTSNKVSPSPEQGVSSPVQHKLLKSTKRWKELKPPKFDELTTTFREDLPEPPDEKAVPAQGLNRSRPGNMMLRSLASWRLKLVGCTSFSLSACLVNPLDASIRSCCSLGVCLILSWCGTPLRRAKSMYLGVTSSLVR